MQGTLEKFETREWVTVDNKGVELFGVLHKPVHVENPPVVVVMHGFASSKHGSNRCYVKLAEAFAKGGLATLRFDFRGSGDSEGALEDTSIDDLISDGVAICKALGKREDVDASKLGLFGASLGGTIALQCSAVTQMTKALALWAPVASGELWFRDFLQQHPEMLGAKSADVLGVYRGIKLNALFKEQFGQLFAYKTLAGFPELPVLHMHGAGDDVISIAHQQAFQQAGGPAHRFVTYPEEQHSLGFAKAFPEVIQETLSFFKEHLV